MAQEAPTLSASCSMPLSDAPETPVPAHLPRGRLGQMHRFRVVTLTWLVKTCSVGSLQDVFGETPKEGLINAP